MESSRTGTGGEGMTPEAGYIKGGGHVDDKDRRERKPKKGEGKGDAPPMQCACRGDEKGHCIPEHHAHVGNELADSLAEGGKHMKQGHLLVREATFKGQGQ